jgi:diguanylate cyclase (GGDEF)-like protein
MWLLGSPTVVAAASGHGRAALPHGNGNGNGTGRGKGNGNGPGGGGGTPSGGAQSRGGSAVGASPGTASAAPSQVAVAPGHSDSAPGHAGSAPGQSGSAPGHSDSAPGHASSDPHGTNVAGGGTRGSSTQTGRQGHVSGGGTGGRVSNAAGGRCSGGCGSAITGTGQPLYSNVAATPVTTPTVPPPVVTVGRPQPRTTPQRPPSRTPRATLGSSLTSGAATVLSGATGPTSGTAALGGAVASLVGVSPFRTTTTTASQATAGRSRSGTGSDPTGNSGSHLQPQPHGSSDPLRSIVRVVPTAIWIALAGALMLAAINGIAALRSNHRMRRQSARLSMVAAAALTDPLTGLVNRRGFIEAAERELARARRHGRPFTLAYVDVRKLKLVNDTYGHRAGDELLRQAAALLAGTARADDVVGRLGGDELAMLLVEQDAHGAEVVSDRIAADVAARRTAIGLGDEWDLTVGTAVFPEDGDTVDALLRTADLRLYRQRGITLG